MAKGRRIQRSALGLALAMVASMAGCRWLPARRASLDGASPAGPAAPSVAMAADSAESVPLPPLPPLRPISDEEAMRPPKATAPPPLPPTPILDAAAARDAEVQRAILGESPIPPPSPPEAPPAEAETPRKETEETDAGRKDGSLRDSDVPAVAEPPPDPSAAWRADIARLIATARDKSREGGPDAELWAARERLLLCLAETGDSSLWKTVLSALAEGSSEPPKSEPEAPPAPIEPEFAVADLRLCRKVVNFGNVVPLPVEAIRPGVEAILYCEVEGLAVEPSGELVRSRMATTVAIVPQAGGEPAWSRDLGIAEDECRRRRRDFFVNYRLTVPPELPPGSYRLRLVQKDLVSGREAVGEAPLVVRP